MKPLSRLSTSFDDAALEDRFKTFRNPSVFVYPLQQFLGAVNLGYNGLIALKASNFTSAGIRLSLCALSIVFFVIDLRVVFLHRMKSLTEIELAKWQHRLRVLAVFAAQAIDLTLTAEFWSCSPKKYQLEIEVCYLSFESKNVVARFMPLWLPVNFFENLLCTSLYVIGEVVLGQLLSGQPTEMRTTRPLYALSVSALLLTIQWGLEQEARRHFLAVVQREELQRKVTQKRQQIDGILNSMTEPERAEQGRNGA
jgi:hypothetical protein